MIKPKNIAQVFSAMPLKEKLLTIFLLLLFFIALGKFIIGNIRLPAGEVDEIFVEGWVGHVKTINPLFADLNDTDRDLSGLIFSPLIRYDPVKKNFLPDLAATWERSKDGLTYTVTLRSNAKWHDFKPVTIEDVLFTFNDVIADPGFRNPILKNAFEGVITTALNPQTIAFKLPVPNSFFISHLTVGIVPKHILENTPIAHLEKSSFGLQPIGSGPFKLTRLDIDDDGDLIDLESFTEYYGEKPKIKRLRIFTFPNEEELEDDISALHAVSKVPSGNTLAQTLKSSGNFEIQMYTLNQFTALYFNTDHPIFKEKKIRQTLAANINKDTLVPAGEMRIDSFDLTTAPNEKETAKKESPSLKEKLHIRLLMNEKMPTKIADELKKQWGAIGIEVEIITAALNDFYRLVEERNYNALLIRQNLGYNRDVYSLFHSSQRGGVGLSSSGLNFSNFKSFRTDGLTEAMRKEKNPADKEKLLQELKKVIADETPVIFISTPVYSYAIDKRLAKFPAATLDYHSDRFGILPYLTTNSTNQ